MGSALLMYMDLYLFHSYYKGSTMNTSTSLKTLLVAITAVTLGSATLAAQADMPAAKAGHDTQPDRAAWMAKRMAKHEAHMHESLMLTPAQEPAWQKFIGATRPVHPAMGQRPDRKAFDALSAPERMSQFIAMEQQHIAQQQTHLEALKTFYAVLTPQQRTVFDHMQRPHHHGHHGWGDEQQQGWHGHDHDHDQDHAQNHDQH